MQQSVPLLDELRAGGVAYAEPLQAMRAFFGQGAAAGFKIFLDDACGMPTDWRETWNNSVQWGLWGNGNWATKCACLCASSKARCMPT